MRRDTRGNEEEKEREGLVGAAWEGEKRDKVVTVSHCDGRDAS